MVISRLDDASEAGIAFRIPQTSVDEFFVLLVSSGDTRNSPSVSLMMFSNNNRFTELSRKPVGIPGSELLRNLEVVDYGRLGLIEGTKMCIDVYHKRRNVI